MRAAFLRGVATAAAVAGAAMSADAQPVAGVYLGAGFGYGYLQSQSVQSPAAIVNSARFGSGLAAVGSVGYGLGNGVRVELEGSWRDNGQSSGAAGNGSESKAGVMVNGLFDMDFGLPWIFPYIGLGGGYQWARWSNVSLPTSIPGSPDTGVLSADGTAGGFAYQAILGAAFPIDAVPGLSVTAEYRFMQITGGRNYGASTGSPPQATTAHSSDDSNHAVLVGVRYAFGGHDDGRPPPRPPLAKSDAAAPVRTYLVFFDWDSAALSNRARDIIAEAARNSAKVAHTRLEVTGHTDSSGAAEYNQALSLKRAQAVATEVERWGIPEHDIDIRGVGDTQPLVPTAAGVREPQNRRVEIVYR
jgi:outer membrane protein OmpA-like peptidoglycan-associated protein